MLKHVPVILGSCAVMECKAHSVHTVGDHHVWYGEVNEAHVDDKISHPMLYHYRWVLISQFYTAIRQCFFIPPQTVTTNCVCRGYAVFTSILL